MKAEQRVRDFETRERGIINNRDLSQEAKTRLLGQLQLEAARNHSEVLADLQADWKAIRQEYKGSEARRAAAATKAAERWNWARLNYVAETVRAEVNRASNLVDLQEKYKKARAVGDDHISRVWSELAPAAAKEKFAALDALAVDRFARAAAADLEKLTYNPEIETLAAAENKLVEKAVALQAETKRVAGYYDRIASTVASPGGREILGTMSGISLKQSFNPENGAGSWTLDVKD